MNQKPTGFHHHVIVVQRDGPLKKQVNMLLQHSFPELQLRTCTNKEEALVALYHARPVALLVEDSMPWLHGKALAEWLHRFRDPLPIIVISAWGPSREWVKTQVQAGQSIRIVMLPLQSGIFEEALRLALENQLTADRLAHSCCKI